MALPLHWLIIAWLEFPFSCKQSSTRLPTISDPSGRIVCFLICLPPGTPSHWLHFITFRFISQHLKAQCITLGFSGCTVLITNVALSWHFTFPAGMMSEFLKGHGKHHCHPQARLSKTPQRGSSNLCYLSGSEEKLECSHRQTAQCGWRSCGRHCSCLQWWIMVGWWYSVLTVVRLKGAVIFPWGVFLTLKQVILFFGCAENYQLSD